MLYRGFKPEQMNRLQIKENESFNNLQKIA